MKTFIYYLTEENNIPFYIGKTKNNLNQRLKQHEKKFNKKCKIFELDFVNINEGHFWEKHYISLFKSWGFKLENKNEGGGGVIFHSKESLLKMNNHLHPGTSEKLKGIKRPDVSKRFLGRKLSKETKDKIITSKTNHDCYKDPKRGKKIKKSNKKHYKLNSLRNKKISSKLLGRKAEWTKIRNIPIIQYDKQENFIQEWNSGTEAGLFLNKKSSAISECCNNKRKSAYGYIWKFKEN